MSYKTNKQMEEEYEAHLARENANTLEMRAKYQEMEKEHQAIRNEYVLSHPNEFWTYLDINIPFHVRSVPHLRGHGGVYWDIIGSGNTLQVLSTMIPFGGEQTPAFSYTQEEYRQHFAYFKNEKWYWDGNVENYLTRKHEPLKNILSRRREEAHAQALALKERVNQTQIDTIENWRRACRVMYRNSLVPDGTEYDWLREEHLQQAEKNKTNPDYFYKFATGQIDSEDWRVVCRIQFKNADIPPEPKYDWLREERKIVGFTKTHPLEGMNGANDQTPSITDGNKPTNGSDADTPNLEALKKFYKENHMVFDPNFRGVQTSVSAPPAQHVIGAYKVHGYDSNVPPTTTPIIGAFNVHGYDSNVPSTTTPRIGAFNNSPEVNRAISNLSKIY